MDFVRDLMYILNDNLGLHSIHLFHVLRCAEALYCNYLLSISGSHECITLITILFILIPFPLRYQPTEPDCLPISALKGTGLDDLSQKVEERILQSTGKQVMCLKVDLSSPQLG